MAQLNPPSDPFVIASFPVEHVILIRMNRPPYNMMSQSAQRALGRMIHWFDDEPSLRIAILTGTDKGFCAGADLKEWMANKDSGIEVPEVIDGFGGVSRRQGKKPIIAMVNGITMGGGMEMMVNCDLVVASDRAIFALPEVKRGVFAKMGALGRIVRYLGLQRASELALIGEPITAQKAMEWGLVNRVVPHEKLVDEALKMAKQVCANSPDSVIVSRTGMLAAMEHGSLERSTQLHNLSPEVRILEQGDNIREGLRSFKEKRQPKWVNSKI